MHLEPPISKSSDIIISSSEEVGLLSGKSGSGSNLEVLSVAQPKSSSTSGCVMLLQILVGISLCDCFLCGAKRSRENLRVEFARRCNASNFWGPHWYIAHALASR